LMGLTAESLDKVVYWHDGQCADFHGLPGVDIRPDTGAGVLRIMNRPGFPGECFICELRLPDHRFRWKHNKLFLLLPEEYGPAFP
ncbi:hypothetical protein MXL70_25920, partial [Escherichia coli]|uniref:hypothetical protein n=1 Tax=Escherichia coli TaxID=562 RepID=UPI002867A160